MELLTCTTPSSPPPSDRVLPRFCRWRVISVGGAGAAGLCSSVTLVTGSTISFQKNVPRDSSLPPNSSCLQSCLRAGEPFRAKQRVAVGHRDPLTEASIQLIQCRSTKSAIAGQRQRQDVGQRPHHRKSRAEGGLAAVGKVRTGYGPEEIAVLTILPLRLRQSSQRIPPMNVHWLPTRKISCPKIPVVRCRPPATL